MSSTLGFGAYHIGVQRSIRRGYALCAASPESERLGFTEHESGERLRKMTPCQLDTSEWEVKKACAYMR